MTRVEFMKELNYLLYEISPGEKQEALDYYNSYFDEAGEENEGKVIQELGSPGKVASIIKADLHSNGDNRDDVYKEYTDQGYQDERFQDKHTPATVHSADKDTGADKKEADGTTSTGKSIETTGKSTDLQKDFWSHNRSQSQSSQDTQRRNGQNQNGFNRTDQSQNGSYQNNSNTTGQYQNRSYSNGNRRSTGYQDGRRQTTGTTVLIVLLCILASPLLIAAGAAALGIIVGILGLIFGIFCALVFGGGGVAIGGIIGLGYGIYKLFVTPGIGLAMMGASFLMIALGILALWIFVKLVKLLPQIINGTVNAIRKLFSGHKGRADQ